MLEPLLSALDTLKEADLQHESGVRLGSAHMTSDGLVLEVFLVPGEDSDEQHWRVECFGLRSFLLENTFVEDLCLVSEHPVLLPFTEHETDLHFCSPSPNPAATVAALFERHYGLVGPWIPFERFLNCASRLSWLLATASGKLASGPVSLMEAYANVLDQHGIRYAMSPGRPPTFWDGETWVASDAPLQAVILDTSYVVAERFDGQKVLADYEFGAELDWNP